MAQGLLEVGQNDIRLKTVESGCACNLRQIITIELTPIQLD